MTDFTPLIQRPTVGVPVTPVYTQCTVADKFYAGTGSTYMLHYKNGATVTGPLFINEKVANPPAGSIPAAPTGASKWSDAQVSSALSASGEKVVIIDNTSPFMDAQGFVNLQHTTPTTLTLAVFGPL